MKRPTFSRLSNAGVQLRATPNLRYPTQRLGRARLLQRSLASVGIEPLIVIVRSCNLV